MPFTELVAPSLTDLFVKQMEHMILSGELKAGERLPTERQLAQKMRVSLAVVNGGINKLADYGFLKIKPRKGVYVADYVREGNVHTLNAIMSFSGSFFSPEYYEPLSKIRKSVEPVIIRDAVKNRTETDLQNLRDAAETFRKVKEANRAGEAAYTFHHEMAIASGNVVYPLALADAEELITRSYEALFHITGKEKYQPFFDGLLEGIQNQDEEASLKLYEQFSKIWDDLYNGGES